jgi:hypothetical protein
MAVEFPAENFQVGMNGPRNERSQTDTDDVNAPLAPTCELIGGDRWTRATAV